MKFTLEQLLAEGVMRPAQLCVQFCAAVLRASTLFVSVLQAMIEDTSVCQAGDKTSGMPFPANASSHQPNPALKTGTVLLMLPYKFVVKATSAKTKPEVPTFWCSIVCTISSIFCVPPATLPHACMFMSARQRCHVWACLCGYLALSFDPTEQT